MQPERLIGAAIKAATTPPVMNGKRDKRQSNRKHRQRLFRKQKTCRWCKVPLVLYNSEATDGKALATLDHVIPLHRGGQNNRNNMVLACGGCNTKRGSDMPEVKAGL